MNRQKELAVKVMELVNEFTHWNFQMMQEGSIYLVGTTGNECLLQNRR